MKLKEIEKKWQKKWEEAKIFEADPNNKPKFFVTFPYPYVNTSPHVGHGYSALRNDMMARFYRMNNYTSLFPLGFHATGEPIVGVAKRLEKGDPSQVRALKLSGIKDEDIEKFKDPHYIVKYFVNEFKKDFKSFGVAVDWRRSFYTTSLNPEYNAFVTWQFIRLEEMGLLGKGTHPVIYCPECKSVAGQHDRKEGENATINEFVLLKFKYGDEYLIAATLRPETVFGQTNLWVNPNVTYVRAKVGNEIWIISEPAFEKLKWQKDGIEIVGKIKGETLIGNYAIAPMIKKEIIILPATFCDPDVGTGIVTSVPSDAPYDYMALEEVKNNEEWCRKYNLDCDKIRAIKPIPIIKIPELGEFAAEKVCKEIGIKSVGQKELLEQATKHVYKLGFHKGIMNENCGKYAGKKVEEVKDKVAEEMIRNSEADRMYETSEPVVCRCLTKCVVKIIKDQWFIKYSDEKWKKKALECIDSMEIYPEEARNVMRNMIVKMKDKACARLSGLGTPLPQDPRYKIEALSDSTIYMSYYIIQKYVHEGKVNVNNMKLEFFDYVLLGKGDLDEVGKKTKLDKELLKEIREEFEYFYPLDLRNSGKDLLTNHLPFFIYNHVAFWPKKYWPRAIAANGWVTVNGEKMSKSKGNFVPLRVAVKEYGADATRLALLDTGEGIADADFSTAAATSFINKLNYILKSVEKVDQYSDMEEDLLDKWLKSKIQKRIKGTIENMKKLLNRTALKDSFHGMLNDIYYYISKKNKPNKSTLRYAWDIFSRLNVPFIPHTCEEINEILGYKEMVHNREYPKPDNKLIDEDAEKKVELLKNIARDITQISNLIGKKPSKVTVIVAKDWKYDFIKEIEKEYKKTKIKAELIKHFMSNEKYKKYGKEVISSINAFLKEPDITAVIGSQNEEYKTIEKNKEFLENEFNCTVVVVKAEEIDNPKAKSAAPGKPGIIIE